MVVRGLNFVVSTRVRNREKDLGNESGKVHSAGNSEREGEKG